jgi:protein-disulfide isomerase
MTNQTRLRTQELRRAQLAAAEKRAKRRRLLTVVGGLVIVGLVAAIVVVIVQAAGRHRTLPEVSGKVVAPQHLLQGGAIPVGAKNAPVKVELYYDYMCSFCGAFEKANSGELDRLVSDGTVRVELHPLAFLDNLSSGTQYSTRTANAIAVVADAAPDQVWAFHSALYAQQPKEGSEGLSDEQIATIAADSGVPADVVDRFNAGDFRPWVASTTRQAFASGIEHTPTLKINGTVFTGDLYKVGPLTQAIESAAGR